MCLMLFEGKIMILSQIVYVAVCIMYKLRWIAYFGTEISLIVGPLHCMFTVFLLEVSYFAGSCVLVQQMYIHRYKLATE